MSLKSGSYRKNLENISIDIVSVKSKAEDAVLEFVDLSAQVQLLDASVNAIQGVGEVITAFPVSRTFEQLNIEYVVQGEGKEDWSLTLSAGTYMFVFTPQVYLVAWDGGYPIWTSTNCNCQYLEYNLGDKQLRMSIYPDLSVPVGEVEHHIKYLGKQTMIFTLSTETTLGLTAKMAAQDGIVIDPTIFGFTISTIEYVKLA
jgi:hypothetical protein